MARARHTVRIVLALALAAAGGGTGAGAAHAVDGDPPTLFVSDREVLPGTKVYLTGVGKPNTQVDFLRNTGTGAYTIKRKKISNPDGSYSLGVTITQSQSWKVIVANQTSGSPWIEAQTQVIRVRATPQGNGRVRWQVNGAPSYSGFVNLYEIDGDWYEHGPGPRLSHVRSNAYGDATFVTRHPTGAQHYLVSFHAPGRQLVPALRPVDVTVT